MTFHEEKKTSGIRAMGRLEETTHADTLHINMVPTRSGQRSFKFKSTNTKNRIAGEGMIIWAFH